jgi:hypothetical protein
MNDPQRQALSDEWRRNEAKIAALPENHSQRHQLEARQCQIDFVLGRESATPESLATMKERLARLQASALRLKRRIGAGYVPTLDEIQRFERDARRCEARLEGMLEHDEGLSEGGAEHRGPASA